MLLTPEATQLPADALARAEALVAANLGASTLEAHAVTQEGVVWGSFVHFQDGPAVQVTSLTVGGIPVTPRRDYWLVELGSGYAGASYEVTYTAGWTVETLPALVRQAILLTARAIAARPDPTVKSESMGPVSRSYETLDGIPTAAAVLLDPWRRLTL